MKKRLSNIISLQSIIFLATFPLTLGSNESQNKGFLPTSPETKLVVEELKGQVNSNYQEFSPSLSPDGNTLYFYSKRNPKSFTDIFSSRRRADGTWDSPEPLNELNSDFDDQSPFITSDGRYLFFSSNREGSSEIQLGDGKIGISRDLYYSEFLDGRWSKVYTFDEMINTSMIEENPHFSNGILLFTRYPFGKPELAKIYMSRYDIKFGWSKPTVLPSPVNDSHSTIAAALSYSGRTIFFSSNRPGGYGGFDLYSMDWENNNPSGQAINLGSEFNTTGDEAYFSYHKVTKTILFARREEGKNFDIFSAYIPKEESIEESLNENKQIALSNIYFKKGSYELLPESYTPLNQIVNYLIQKTNIKMLITGHTDLNGNFDENIALSLNRANSVKNFLTEKGIDSSRIVTKGLGSKEPLYLSKDELSSSKNRRTEFKIISE